MIKVQWQETLHKDSIIKLSVLLYSDNPTQADNKKSLSGNMMIELI